MVAPMGAGAGRPGDSIETLYVDIAARADQLVTEAEEAIQLVTRRLKKLDEPVAEAEGLFKRLGGTIKNVLTIATGVSLANFGQQFIGQLVGIGKQLISTNAQMQMFEQSFTVLTGSAEEAGEIIEWVKEQAKATPFDIPGLINASQMLMTWGLDLKEWFTVVGDVAAGMNRPISQVVNAIGTLATGQTGEAVRRFRDLGINLRQFTDQLTFDARGMMITPLEQAIPIVKQIMIDKFGGMMEQQSKTWSGVMSNMSDTWMQFIQVVGEPVFDTLNDQLFRLYEWIEENEEALENFARNLGELLSSALDTLVTIITKSGEFIAWVVDKAEDLAQATTGEEEGGLGRVAETGRQAAAITFSAVIALVGQADDALSGHSVTWEKFRLETLNTMTSIAGNKDEYIDTINDLREEMGYERLEIEATTEAQVELTEAQIAGAKAVRDLTDAMEYATDEEIVETFEAVSEEQLELARRFLESGVAIEKLPPMIQQLIESNRELIESTMGAAEAFHEEKNRVEELEAALEAARAAAEALRAEQEASLQMALEVGPKLTERLKDAMEDYEATIDKITQATRDAIAEIEAEAASAESEALKRHQDEVAKMREDYAREQLRRRRQFNMDWARLIRDQNQEVIDAEWEYEFAKQDLLIEGDEIALAELEARYAHEKDVRAREHGDARSDMQQRHEFENQQRQEQHELALRQLEERLRKEIEDIRTKAREEVEAKKAALEERLIHEDQKLEERLKKIAEMLLKETGDNQEAAAIIMQAWRDAYGDQIANAVNAGVVARRELDAIIERALRAAAAVRRIGVPGRDVFESEDPLVYGGLAEGGYTAPYVARAITHPDEWMANPDTTRVLESAIGGPLSQEGVRKLADSHRILDVFLHGYGMPADQIEAIRRELVDGLARQGSEF